MITRIGLYWRTIRHLKPEQILWRVQRRVLRHASWCWKPSQAVQSVSFDSETLVRLENLVQLYRKEAPASLSTAQALRNGAFAFLNHTEMATPGPPWTGTEASRLWRYQLHYFDFVRQLIFLPEADAREEDEVLLLRWVEDWIAQNPVGTSVAWDAFPTSLRLMNWALLAAVYGWDSASIRTSFVAQARWLRHHVEFDVLGNHVLINAAALVLADQLCTGKISSFASRLLRREVERQILSDGGHVERSVMYHVQVLEVLLFIYAAVPEPPAFLHDALLRMAQFLAQVLHADDEIPLFGDAALGETASPRGLLRIVYALLREEASVESGGDIRFENTGYFVFNDAKSETRMIVKAGAPGSPYQLGHAHCDMLSYEMTVQGRRVIVDSGTHGYADSPYREYCRSTRAHNTVVVNEKEQMECWSTFRVGRRYVPTVHPPEACAQDCLLHAEHDGFAPYRHARRFFRKAGEAWGIADTVWGPGAIQAESYIHVHPAYTVEQVSQGWRIEGDGLQLLLCPFGACEVTCVRAQTTPQQGWYFPEFGVAHPAATLIIQAQGDSKITFGYAIVPGADTAPNAPSWPFSWPR